MKKIMILSNQNYAVFNFLNDIYLFQPKKILTALEKRTKVNWKTII